MNKKREIELLKAKVMKSKKEDLKMIKRASNWLDTFLEHKKMTKEGLETFLEANKMTKKELVKMTDSKKVEDDFPGGTIIPEERGIKWIKTLEKCEQDLYGIENPVADKVLQKIEGILGELRVMTGNI